MRQPCHIGSISERLSLPVPQEPPPLNRQNKWGVSQDDGSQSSSSRHIPLSPISVCLAREKLSCRGSGIHFTLCVVGATTDPLWVVPRGVSLVLLRQRKKRRERERARGKKNKTEWDSERESKRKKERGREKCYQCAALSGLSEPLPLNSGLYSLSPSPSPPGLSAWRHSYLFQSLWNVQLLWEKGSRKEMSTRV